MIAASTQSYRGRSGSWTGGANSQRQTSTSELQFRARKAPVCNTGRQICACLGQQCRRSGVCVAELWTDVEFLSLSHASCRSVTLTKDDYHELDLIIVGPGQQGRPSGMQEHRLPEGAA